MDIKINRGIKIEDALNLIRDFLMERYPDYCMLESDLSMHVTLTDSNGQICPDDEHSYVLSERNIKDAFVENYKKALEELRMDWDESVCQIARYTDSIKKQIVLAENHQNTAIGKKYKAVDIEKLKYELKMNENFEKLIVFLDSLVKEDKMITTYVKKKKGSSYAYRIEAAYIFDNVIFNDDDFTGYFTKRYGLRYGLPDYYNK